MPSLSKNLIIYLSQMQGEQWVILLYSLPSEPESKVRKDIVTAVKPYVALDPVDIQLISRDEKYSAILKLPADKAQAIEALKELKVGESVAFVKRYYYDHQLYINRMPKDIPSKEITKYFSNFGPVVNVVLVPSIKNDDKYCHCFIKFEHSKSVDKVLQVRKLELSGREIRAFRTFRLGENDSTDKRLEIIVEPIPESIEVFENQINQHFQALGELRERLRFQVHDKKTCKGILTFTSKEKAEEVLNKFDASAINKGIYKIELRYWNHVVEEGCKVFVPGLLRTYDEARIKAAFQTYGEVTDLTLTPNKMSHLCNAIVTFAKKSSAMLLLAEYLYNQNIKRLFAGKPHIEFYLNAGDRINYNNYMHKGKPSQKSYHPPPVNLNYPNPSFNAPGQFLNPYPPAQNMMPPAFIPRPNFTNPK